MNTTQRTKKGIINEDEESEPFIEDGENAFNGNPATTSTATAIRQESSSKYKGLIMGFSMIACCLNMWFMEALLRLSPRSANFASFLQHLFITGVSICTLGLPFGLLGSRPSSIPVKYYLPLVFLNLSAVLANNQSYNYGVSIPLNMIFKSSSLIANMLLGMIILSHRYPVGKYLAIFLITSGLIMCTFEDYRLKYAAKTNASPVVSLNNVTTPNPLLTRDSQKIDLLSQTIGIAFLTLSLLLSSGTGIYQEFLRNRFGKHPEESLFYVHLLSLPFFTLVAYSDLGHHWVKFTESALTWTDPSYATQSMAIVHLVFTVLTQYACIRSVYKLTTECTSLTVTLVVTIRKFLSIILSVAYFGNPFTATHWCGTVIVFSGTFLFSRVDLTAKKTAPDNRQPAVKSAETLK